MTFGLRSDTVYAATELRKPGWNSSVTAAPPTTLRRSSTVTLSPAAAKYAAQTSPLWPPPTITASRGDSATVLSRQSAGGSPAGARCTLEPALRNEFAHAARKTSQRYLVVSQRARTVAARAHAGLHPFDQRLVLQADSAIDAPIQVACRAHFAPVIRVRIGNLAHQSFGGRYRNHLHEVALVRIDVEGHVRPQLEVGP